MTVSYQGNNLYKIHIGHNLHVMSTEEIIEVANYANENEFAIDKANVEEEYIDKLEKQVEELQMANKDWEFEVEQLAKQIDSILNNNQ